MTKQVPLMPSLSLVFEGEMTAASAKKCIIVLFSDLAQLLIQLQQQIK